MKVEFSAREAISQACTITKDNWYILAVIYLVYAGVSSIPSVGTLIALFLSAGMTKIYLDVAAGRQISFDAFKLPLSTYCNFVIAMIVNALVVCLGCVLLIVPGIYIGVRLSFVSQFVIDRELGFMDALKASWEVTKDNAWHLFLAMLLIGLFALVGILCFGIGLLYTAPVASVATVIVYRHFVPAEVAE